MRPVYRVGLRQKRVICIEHWPSWEAFDALRPEPRTFPSDLAYSDGEVRLHDLSGTCFELQRLRVNNGGLAAAKQLLAEDVAMWRAAGAQVIGRFEVVHGHDLPALLLLLNWESAERAAEAGREIESSTALNEKRQQDRLASGRAAIRASSRVLGCTLCLE